MKKHILFFGLVVLLLLGANAGVANTCFSASDGQFDLVNALRNHSNTQYIKPYLENIDAYMVSSAEFQVSGENLERVAAALYTYIYGLAPSEMMRKAYNQTNPTDDPVYAPLNELYIGTALDTPDSQLFVSPNVNVLYSSAHLDLSKEPMVLHTPSIQDRYFVWEMMDAYSNDVHYVGTRATGGEEGTYVICGPNWNGTLPDGATKLEFSTNNAWIVARHEVSAGSTSDLDEAILLVRLSTFLPLSEYKNKTADYLNPIIEKPDDTGSELDTSGLNFFSLLNEWLTANPPPTADATAVEYMAKIGVGEGYTTDFESLPTNQQDELLLGQKIGELAISEGIITLGTGYNGWRYTLASNFGDWGTDYFLRAVIAHGGLGANINEEAIYPERFLGPNNLPLTGDKNYVLKFSSDQLPVPVNDSGFWSVTMYDRTTGGLVSNSIDRYTIGSQNSLNYASDGSLTIYLQADDPGGDKTDNWLPSPSNDDPFYLLFRMYYPDSEAYTPTDGPDWVIPNLERFDDLR